ncbi:baseplate J/gp47 family protein [Comamonas sp. Y33R10-2]|uniref:baseplate assembly protein n=1 Tax=Comamonas sp. Y33R10-2 TaxID=2853257 RepID=UPI001C5C8B54|nr:baseplate J/gp47 family protein [Comamonas sp. Y33R10-2]QXZ10270.1 baseplate J/gp47 family protein [Comamonas sp. Y33R10-2]
MSVDLSQLPAPNVVQPLDFEAELVRIKNLVLTDMPELADVLQLESEPVTKLLQRWAYESINMQAHINDSAHAVMLAYAVGPDLDQVAANNGVERLEGEDNDQLRRRAQMAFEGLTVAGSRGSYVFHALSADARVLDANALTPIPGTVRMVVLSADGNGSAPADLLQAVQAALSAEDVRPLCDTVETVSVQVVNYAIAAQLRAYPGPSMGTVLQSAQAAIATYIESCRKLGYDITRSGIYAALHVQGVQNVMLTSPAADVVIDSHQVGYCTGIDLQLAEATYV